MYTQYKAVVETKKVGEVVPGENDSWVVKGKNDVLEHLRPTYIDHARYVAIALRVDHHHVFSKRLVPIRVAVFSVQFSFRWPSQSFVLHF
jgi:hypothetical protein